MKPLLTSLLALVLSGFVNLYGGNNREFHNVSLTDGSMDNYVIDITHDSNGFSWVATPTHLCRYDGYDFIKYPLSNTASIREIWLESDNEGRIWLNNNGNVYYIDDASGLLLKAENLPMLQKLGKIDKMFLDRDKRSWFVASGHACQVDSGGNQLKQFILPADERIYWLHGGNGFYILTCTSGNVYVCDNDTKFKKVLDYKSGEGYIRSYLDIMGRVWVYSQHVGNKLAYFSKDNYELHEFKDERGLPIYSVTDITDDDSGLWIATDVEGLIHYDYGTKTMTRETTEWGNSSALPSNHLTCVDLQATTGELWVGTSKRGLAYSASPYIGLRQLNVGNNSDVLCFADDQDGNLWIGTDGNGLHHTRYNKDMSLSQNPTADISQSKVILCSAKSPDGTVWFGTYGDGIFMLKNGKFVRPNISNENQDIIEQYNYVRCLDFDKSGNLWIGTIVNGLYKLDMTSGKVSKYIDNLQSTSITDLYCRNHQIYVATPNGLSLLNPNETRFGRCGNAEVDTAAINAMIIDSRHLVWLGTNNGVIVYDENSSNTYHITAENGLSHNYVRGFAEDDFGNVWVSTNCGISRVTPNYGKSSLNFDCSRYFFRDYIGEIGFNTRAIYKTETGYILVGGQNSCILVNPYKLNNKPADRNVLFTGLKIGGKSIDVGEEVNGEVILDKNLWLSDQLHLKHNNNTFSITVSDLGLAFNDDIIYAYKLNNDSLWTPITGNTINFKNLAPGKYDLQVCNMSNGFDPDKISHLAIVVSPPFWRSVWAYVIYAIVIIGLIVFGFMYFRRRNIEKMKRQKMELDLAAQHEIDEAQMLFFTNISHDLRTPLSLIISPVEQMLSSATIAQNPNRANLELVHRNALLLMDEVNQLLDFRKIQKGKQQLKLTHGNLSTFLKDICNTLNIGNWRGKKVSMKVEILDPAIIMDYDPSKIQRVVTNLVANAYKFNVEDGKITVTVDTETDDKGLSYAVIKVADTGVGIPDKNKSRVFDRFFQDVNATDKIGSGIGLHIVKEFVDMHKGTVDVSDNHPKGTVFTVRLPIQNNADPEGAPTEPTEDIALSVQNEAESKGVSILVVEDNDDMREFIVNSLSPHFSILSTSNGKEALDIMSKESVSLVLTDLMMPVMDGLELCNTIKHDVRFSHIPVIMLTAKATQEHILEGLQEGADDYIVKPFNLNILLLRINKILDWSLQNHKKFETQEIEASEITVSSLDEELITKAIKKVEENITDTEYSVENLASDLGMTRGHLYKKLMAITGKSPLEFIRVLRVKRGKQLLEKSQYNISEVAYMVGFSPKIFSKHFKDLFGCSPTEFRAKITGEN